MKNKFIDILFVFGFLFWCKILFMPILFIADMFNNKELSDVLYLMFDYGFLFVAIALSFFLLFSNKIEVFVRNIYNKLPNVRIYFIFSSWLLISTFFLKELVIYGMLLSIFLAIVFDLRLKLHKKIFMIVIVILISIAVMMGNMFYSF